MNIPFIDINSGEFIIIVIIALVLIGPKRLPGYVDKPVSYTHLRAHET